MNVVHLRLREAVYEIAKGCPCGVVNGFWWYTSAMLLVTARELELALCGTPTLDLDEWKKHHGLQEAFASDAPSTARP